MILRIHEMNGVQLVSMSLRYACWMMRRSDITGDVCIVALLLNWRGCCLDMQGRLKMHQTNAKPVITKKLPQIFFLAFRCDIL